MDRIQTDMLRAFLMIEQALQVPTKCPKCGAAWGSEEEKYQQCATCLWCSDDDNHA